MGLWEPAGSLSHRAASGPAARQAPPPSAVGAADTPPATALDA